MFAYEVLTAAHRVLRVGNSEMIPVFSCLSGKFGRDWFVLDCNHRQTVLA